MRQITFAITTLFLSVSVAHAAPEDRGQRGPLFGVSAGALSGTAWDEDGREGGAHLGYAFALRLGEEALPNLSLGLEFLGGVAQGNNSKYSLGFGGLLIHASWRAFKRADGLILLIGTGVGGGAMSEVSDSGFSGSIFGALHMVGVQYDFFLGERNGRAWTISPSVRVWAIPASGSMESQLLTAFIGLEFTRYSGRVTEDFKAD